MASQVDLRLEELVGRPTINERLMSDFILRSLRTLRLANGESRKVVGFLNREVLPDLLGRLRDRLEREEAAGGPPSRTAERQAEYLRIIAGVTRPGYARALADVTGASDAIARSEAQAAMQTLQAAMPAGVGVTFAAPAPGVLAAAVREEAFGGHLLRNWFDIVEQRSQQAILGQLNIGIDQGETADQIMRRLRGTRENDYTDGVLEATRREAETLVRTAVRHVTSSARLATYDANSDIIDGYTIVATLDTRTCPICAGLDGRFIKTGEAGPSPPFHPNCRCDTSPVVKGLPGLPPGQRASVEGPVPDTVTYGEWLKGQPQAVQEDVLGVRKAALFRSGELEIGEFSDERGRILTLDELDRKLK